MIKFFFRTLTAGVLLCISSCSVQDQYSDPYEKEALLKLINRRLQVAPLVAKSKWNTKAPIDDPAREKIILDTVEIKAKKLLIDTDFAHDFFQAQFEAGKLKQRQLHEKWTAEHQPPFDPAPDLATEVRPVLDSLTPLLLNELKKIKPNSCTDQAVKKLKIQVRKLTDSSFDDETVAIAVQPIEDYCKHISIPKN